jgi:hypothetical protein
MAVFKVGCVSNRRKHFLMFPALLQSRVWKTVALGLLITISLSILSGVTANAIREEAVPLVPEYVRNHSIKHIAIYRGSIGEFRGVLFDARPHRIYKECHVPQAFNFPPGKFDFFYGLRLSGTSREMSIFIYGRTYSRAFDEQLAHQLFLKGHQNVTVVRVSLACS